ncbi:MAG: transporter substrate-binding domain-containing protein [Spirochaetales bacterium]|nr:transporter substrate-binding domain-containing protein [Spirochaetales bacterium]
MKKILGVISLMLFGFSLFSAETVFFAIGEWEPYTDPDMDTGGFAVEIVSAACAAAGLVPEYRYYPWKRAEANILGGTEFATFPYVDIPERSDDYLFSDVLFTSYTALAYLEGAAAFQELAAGVDVRLENLAVGVVRGSDAVKLAAERAGAVVSEVDRPRQNIGKLHLGRIDAYLDDYAVLAYAIQGDRSKAYAGEIVIHEKPFGESKRFRLMVSRKYPESGDLLSRFNNGLAAIRSNGLYKEILDKYGL